MILFIHEKVFKIQLNTSLPNTSILEIMAAASAHLAKTYQKKTDREHILDAPDTYIGSIEKDTVQNWIYNGETEKMVHREYEWVPGLYKCFDEGIVNCRDHFVRQQQKLSSKTASKDIIPVKTIAVDVDKESGVVTMYNDGNGVDVAKHPEHDIWIPEMIFGHLRSSTNYNKDEKKIVGGKNGFGFKLVLIYSKWGSIETVDHVRKLKYKQEFKDNLQVIEKPSVTKNKSKPYTKISFLPDYERFGLKDGLSDDMFALFKKRVYDIAAVTEKSVKVKFNDAVVPVQSFEKYVDMYIGSKGETTRVFEKGNDRWEYAVCVSPHGEFTQVSFVNGIYTAKGGKHVDYILGQVVRKVVDFIEKKKKVRVNPVTIKEQLMLFVNCVIENPSFDSQTKETLNTASSKFGSTCRVSEKFAEKVAKLGVMEQAVAINEVKENKVAKKTDGKKTRQIRGIPKLTDANYAGTANSQQCTLILCEGDSAKAGIVSGLSREDRNFIGIYPLKGKLMNVRDMSVTRVNTNAEIVDLKKIMGLELGKKYKTSDDVQGKLRYGKIVILCDQDVDGSHIKGLCLNLFDSQWGDLIKVPGFLAFMNTPILKAKKGSNTRVFYDQGAYESWKESTDGAKGWTIKYYKGLGTSTAKEFKEYFAAEQKFVSFEFGDDSCRESLDKVFNKKRADDRKEWLANYDKNARLTHSTQSVSYKDFVDKELIHFSKYDNERSIPNLVDGLKTSQRKILFSAFKRNLTKEIKVAQFGGYVSEHSGYHHGEKSLMEAIKGMAQNFVGSNNINLFAPNGQFGTRLQGGADAASERYIFTQLNPVTTKLYRPEDIPTLTQLDDDGQLVEPEYYVPVIPMAIVNGAQGIGTGFSTNVYKHSPVDTIAYLRHKLTDGDVSTAPVIHPYVEGFKGTIVCVNDGTQMVIKGVYECNKDTVHITELPVGTWTDSYKEFLEGLIDCKKPVVKEYSDMSTDTTVDITVKLVPGCATKLQEKIVKSPQYGDVTVNELEKTLKLVTTEKYSNMHFFDKDQRLRKFETIDSIVEDYFPVRLAHYQMRKDHMIKSLEKEVMLLSNRARFIEEQCNDTIDLRRKKKDAVVALLKSHKYDIIGDDIEYKYLRSMPIDSVIEENIEKLRSERDAKMKELECVKCKTVQKMWMDDLDELEMAYKKHVDTINSADEDIGSGAAASGSSTTKKKKKVVRKKKVAKK